MAQGAQATFFSYSRDDSEFAIRLAEDLKAVGANVWIDQLDIEPGMPWDRAVESAVTNCPHMLVILSPASVNSDNVRDEISFALSKQKRVIPVLYRECNVPFRLARLQHIDFRTDYARGLKTLVKVLSVEQQSVAARGADVSGMPRESPTEVSNPDKRKRVIEEALEERKHDEEARLEEKRKQDAEQAQIEQQRRRDAEEARLEKAEASRLKAQQGTKAESVAREKARKVQMRAEVERVRQEAVALEKAEADRTQREQEAAQKLTEEADRTQRDAERAQLRQQEQDRADAPFWSRFEQEERRRSRKYSEAEGPNSEDVVPKAKQDRRMLWLMVVLVPTVFLLIVLGSVSRSNKQSTSSVTSDYEQRLSRGIELEKGGNADGAIAAYREMLSLYPTGEVHGRLARLLDEKGDTDAAIVAYRELLGSYPYNWGETLRLLNLLVAKHAVDDVYSLAQQAVKMWPNDSWCRFYLGWAMGEKSDVDGAIEQYREAVGLNFNNHTAHNNLGLELEHKGDRRGALREYQTAVRLDPKEPLYRKNVNRLSR